MSSSPYRYILRSIKKEIQPEIWRVDPVKYTIHLVSSPVKWLVERNYPTENRDVSADIVVQGEIQWLLNYPHAVVTCYEISQEEALAFIL